MNKITTNKNLTLWLVFFILSCTQLFGQNCAPNGAWICYVSDVLADPLLTTVGEEVTKSYNLKNQGIICANPATPPTGSNCNAVGYYLVANQVKRNNVVVPFNSVASLLAPTPTFTINANRQGIASFKCAFNQIGEYWIGFKIFHSSGVPLNSNGLRDLETTIKVCEKPIVNLTAPANPTTVSAGTSVNLTWVGTNTNSTTQCHITGYEIGIKEGTNPEDTIRQTGTTKTIVVNQTTKFRVRAKNGLNHWGVWTTLSTINVVGVSPPPTNNGTLTVNLTGINGLGIAVPAPAGAQWSPDGGSNYFDSGVQITRPVGNYTITFKNVTDWGLPPNISAVVTDSDLSEYNAVYTQNPGKGIINVIFKENGVPSNDAKFKYKLSGGDWKIGGIDTEVDSGVQDIDFIQIPGYNTPTSFIVGATTVQSYFVQITVGQTTVVTVNYTTANDVGSLQVFINPVELRNDLLWSIDQITWYSHAQVLPNIAIGSVKIYFKNVTGYQAPDNRVAIITKNNTTPETGEYILKPISPGRLVVKILPNSVLALGAKWGILGMDTSPTRLNNTYIDLPAGTYTIFFSSVTNYITPGNILITITSGGDITQTGIYVPGSDLNCPTPNNLQSVPSLNSANIIWVGARPLNATNYDVQWRKVEIPATGWNTSSLTYSNGVLVLDGLLPNTEYEVQVALKCTPLPNPRNWTSIHRFKTKAIPANGIMILAPNGGEVYTTGGIIQIKLAKYGTSVGTAAITLKYSTDSGVTYIPIPPAQLSNTNNLPNSYVTKWNIPNSFPPSDRMRIKAEISNTIFDESDADFTIKTNFNCNLSNFPATPNAYQNEVKEAICYLVERGFIDATYNSDFNNSTLPILRKDLARLMFAILYGGQANIQTEMDNAACYFYDIPNHTQATDYHRYAKLMSLLEWRESNTNQNLDGISVFTRNNANFHPDDPIMRKYVLKVFVEALNISKSPVNDGDTVPFGDMCAIDDTWVYVKTMLRIGRILAPNPNFNPNVMALRGEALIWTKRLLEHNAVTVKKPSKSDYFDPGVENNESFSKTKGAETGNLVVPTKTSFALGGRITLDFTHIYELFTNDRLNEFYEIVTPFGKGWTHNWNIYMKRTNKPIFPNTPSKNRMVIRWATGLHAYELKNGSTTEYKAYPQNATYDELTDIGGGKFTLRTKDNTLYTFTLISPTDYPDIYFLTEIKDRNNNTFTLTYNTTATTQVCNGGTITSKPMPARLERITESVASRSIELHYNSLNKIYAVSESALGREVNFGYNNDLKLATFTDAENNPATQYFYGQGAFKDIVTRLVLPRGNTYEMIFDKDRKCLANTVYMAGGSRIELSKTAPPKASSVTSPSTSGNIEYPDGTKITTTYDASAGSNNNATQIQSSYGAGGGSTVFVDYDATHNFNPTQINDTDGLKSKVLSYDTKGNPTLVQTLNKAGQMHRQFRFTYHQLTNQVEQIIEDHMGGRNTRRWYNTQGHLVTFSPPMGMNDATYRTNFYNNAFGQPIKVVNPEGIETNIEYDNLGLPKEIYSLVNGQGYSEIRTKTLRDLAGRTHTITNPQGQNTIITHNNNDNVTSETFINDYKLTYTIDPNGNTTAITPQTEGDIKNATAATLDQTDRVTKNELVGTGMQSEYTYDSKQRPEKVIKAEQVNGVNTITTNYDDKNRVIGTSATDVMDKITYVPAGTCVECCTDCNRIKTIENNTGKYTFYYDAMLRTNQYNYASKIGGINYTIKYDWYPDGKLKEITYPNSLKVTYIYDPNGRMTALTVWNGKQIKYYYKRDGRMDWYERPNGINTGMGYDNAARLTQLRHRKTAQNQTLIQWDYVLDVMSRHTQVNRQGTELMPYPTGEATPTTYEYNADKSNRITKINNLPIGVNNNGVTTNLGSSQLQYDLADRLTSLQLTANHPNNLQCAYDPLGFLASVTRGTTTTHHAWDIQGIGNILVEYDASGTPLYFYIYGANGLEARIDPAGNMQYYHADFRGSTVLMSNDAGDVINRYSYGDYGDVAEAQETSPNYFRYVGRYGILYLNELLYSMRARMYSPQLKRFLSADPVWHPNLYNYCNNNPILFIDIDGQKYSLASIMDNTQIALAGVGMIPGLGEIADAADAVISLARGDYVGAALSVASMNPFGGQVAGAANITRKFAKHGDEVVGSLLKYGDDITSVKSTQKLSKKQEKINNVWEKAEPMPGQDPSKIRMDPSGRPIMIEDYGKRNSIYGWEIEHFTPKSKGGTNDISNLFPGHWLMNAKKSNKTLSDYGVFYSNYGFVIFGK